MKIPPFVVVHNIAYLKRKVCTVNTEFVVQ